MINYVVIKKETNVHVTSKVMRTILVKTSKRYFTSATYVHDVYPILNSQYSNRASPNSLVTLSEPSLLRLQGKCRNLPLYS